MPDLRVRRTLVKSPPELWAELSEVEGLERHLGEFGEITITRAEPETTVAWEGENASGTVELEPTGWGTKVTITAEVAEAAAEGEAAEPEPDPELESPVPSPQSPEPVAIEPDPGPFEPEADPFDPQPMPVPEPRRRGFISRWFTRERREETPVPAHPVHRLSEFPEEPEPQLLAWSAQEAPAEPAPQPEPPRKPEGDLAVEASQSDDADFEFDFAIRRGDEPAETEQHPREPIAPDRAQEVLETALENLGQAHHRPFSRG